MCFISPIMNVEAHIRRLELNAPIFSFFFLVDFCKGNGHLNATRAYTFDRRPVWTSTAVRGCTRADVEE